MSVDVVFAEYRRLKLPGPAHAGPNPALAQAARPEAVKSTLTEKRTYAGVSSEHLTEY